MADDGIALIREVGALSGRAGALDGIRVLDLTSGLAGSVAGMLLGDLGADVVKIYPLGAMPETEPGVRVWDRNKLAAVADLARHEHRHELDRLVRAADVVLVGTAEDGISYEYLRQRGLALGQTANWIVMPSYLLGDTPWRAQRESAGLVFAFLGHAWSQASYDDVPVDCLLPVTSYMLGIWAATIAVALLAGGRPNHGKVAIAGEAHGGILVSPGSFVVGADEPNEYRPGGPGGTLPNYRCYRCSDGLWLFLGAFTSAFIRRGFEVIGAGHILEDPRIGGDPGRVRSPENLNWITLELDQLFTRRPRAEWLQMLESADVPVAPVLSADTWLDHEQVRATGLRAELRDDLGRPVTMPGVFVTLSDTPASIRRAAPVQPLPIAELAARWPSGSSVPSGSAAPADLPLRGIRVLDLGTVIAGPYLATLLGELGAEVVKVERPPHGDEYRVAHGGRGGVGFPVYNRGQRSLMLDLAQGGRAAFLELVRSAEVIVDNYRPGVLRRLQIDHDQLASVNPLLVSASVSAFGQRGPLGGRPGFDPVVQAMSGIMRSQGGQDESNSPVFLTVPINDVLAAGLGALGVCAALYARRRIGRGQQVSVTLCAAATLVQSDRLVRYEGRPLPGDGGRDFSGPGALKRLYRAADGWVRLDGDWPDDLPGLERAGLATAGLRQSATAVSPAAAVDAIAGSLADLPVDEVLRRALSVGVPAVRVRHARELAEDDQLAGQGLLDVTTPGEPVAHVAPGRWLQIPGLAQPPAGRAPEPGEHSLAVLLEAGLTRHEVSQLAKMEAVKLTATDALLVAEAAVNPTPD